MIDPASKLKTRAILAVEAMRRDLIALSERIHAHPELAFQEFQAAAWLSAILSRHGFTVEQGIGDLPTAFRAAVSGPRPGPTIAFLAEYDALPSMGHACGHNIIGTAAIGAALALRRLIRWLSGRIVVIGTPAEEAGGGKVILLRRGCFDDVDVALMIHPSIRNAVARGSLATNAVLFEFEGRAAHAAAAPDEGINALDAVIQTFVSINALRQQLRPDARIGGIIVNGGAAANIIPAYASARFSIRAQDQGYAQQVVQRVIHCAEAGALATGATLKVTRISSYDEMWPNFTIARAFQANLEALGRRVVGADPNERMGSTDTGTISHYIPTVHAYVAIAPDSPEGISSHTPEFAAAAVSPTGHAGLLDGAKALAMTAIDLLTDPDLLPRAKAELVQKRNAVNREAQ